MSSLDGSCHRRVFYLLFTLLCALSLASATFGEVWIIPTHDAPDPIVGQQAAQAQSPSLAKADQPDDLMILPFFEVDTSEEGRVTTLYAVRNTRQQPIDVDIHYCDPKGNIVQRSSLELAPRETHSVNLRDIPGLLPDEDGIARGMVTFLANSARDGSGMVGDFLQVHPHANHATGDRLISLYELCDMSEVRFLDFGQGTHLRILLSQPRGIDLFEPSFTVTPILENGTTLGSSSVYTDQILLELDASAFTSERFGSLIFDFSNGSGGYVYAEYSAEDRFSIGFNSACLEFEKAP